MTLTSQQANWLMSQATKAERTRLEAEGRDCIEPPNWLLDAHPVTWPCHWPLESFEEGVTYIRCYGCGQLRVLEDQE